MKCILHGHRPIEQEGKGDHAGCFSRFCADCGEIFEIWGEKKTLQAVNSIVGPLKEQVRQESAR